MESGQEKFKPQKRYELPEEILREIESIDENEFWIEENLERQFEEDVSFGAKMQVGLGVIFERKNLYGNTPEFREFLDRAEPLNSRAYTPKDQVKALLEIRKWISEKFNIPLKDLGAGKIIFDAYQSEAKIMDEIGINPELNPPYSFSIGLNEDHPLVKEVMQKQAREEVKAGGELLEKLLESSPSLKRKMDEFEGGLQPPQEKIE